MFKNTIISFLVIGSTFASAAPIQWNNIPVPDYSSSNQAYSQGNQQVQQGLQQMADALSNFGRQEQQTYTRVGDHSYGSDGSSYYHSNGNTYGSNGVNTYSMNDNSGYSSNGSTYYRVGDYIYINNPDGTRTVCYVSDVGTQCR